ncbi:hypothetical protein EUZ85_25970 [Hahella sp. KA22]|uniref:hypothetical protein n=1 Tax=Hahella sp. KA22 TaxID=1628392 RepID=UPI000FDD8885|nr:hypothetical protein [Hahella sp. KA22]AZZ93984.1 hypothetical protein ENC22_23385 [Hahella sp. KA22]QAY57358.1 hypothetical protein EUZ85_25970 [Hahella sp. KA22]
MNLVKWIFDDEIEVALAQDFDKALLTRLGFKLNKTSKHSRATPNVYYIPYPTYDAFSPTTYVFTHNERLRDICLRLHELGFVFWGTFKTEKSPIDYMRELQYRGVLTTPFRALNAGDLETVLIDETQRSK